MADFRKWGGALQGMRETQAAFRRLPIVSAERLNEATESTAIQVAGKARQRVPVRFGFLRNAIAYKLLPKSGGALVGLTRGTIKGALGHMAGVKGAERQSARIVLGKGGGVKGSRLIMPSRYGHLVEFGHGGPHPAGAHPFMLPSAEEERQPYLRRCKESGQKIERDMSVSRFQ